MGEGGNPASRIFVIQNRALAKVKDLTTEDSFSSYQNPPTIIQPFSVDLVHPILSLARRSEPLKAHSTASRNRAFGCCPLARDPSLSPEARFWMTKFRAFIPLPRLNFLLPSHYTSKVPLTTPTISSASTRSLRKSGLASPRRTWW